MAERHIMLDLETLSTRTTASIVSIGAIEFDPHGDDSKIWPGDPKRRNPFYRLVRAPLLDPHFHVDYDTLSWWMEQPDGARAEFTSTNRVDLHTALILLYSWIKNDDPDFKVQDVVIWSHEGFDLPILTNAYNVLNSPPPFWYRSGRDIRTIIHAAFGRNLDVEEEVEGFPTNPKPHHPVWDAWHQAVMVQECFRRLSVKQ